MALPRKKSPQTLASQINEHWDPHVIAELNGQEVRLAKLKGEFVWHAHEQEDEMFYVLEGELDIEFRDGVVGLSKGEMLVVPKGVEHRPVAREEVLVLLFEPSATINTGKSQGELTRKELKRL
jgi:mannose-6-phosphate isomerase-like protein (cupin superfamily)